MSGAPSARHASVRRVAEVALTARNASRLLTGTRLTDGQALQSLAAEAESSLRDARSRFRLPPHWTLGDRLTTVADVAVLELRDGAGLAAVLKLARSPAGELSLHQQQETLQRLADDPGLGQWRRLLPEVLAHGVAGVRRYSIERAVPGTVGTSLTDPAETAAAARNAVRAIAELHRATGHAAVASPALVDGWLAPALSLVAEVPMLLGPTRRHRLLDRLRDRILAGVDGRTVWVGRIHGDYFPGNIFFGRSRQVAGIIDWGQSREDDAALIDPMTLVLIGRARARRTGLGRVVRDLCRGVPLTGHELALLDCYRAACPADPVAVEVMALLAWLRHVENNLLKSPRYRANAVWVHGTLEAVLKAAAG